MKKRKATGIKMKMKSLMMVGVFAVCIGASGAAQAAWQCNNGGQAGCYVNYVELNTADSTSNDTYVLASISAPYGGTSCTTIKIRKGSNASIDTIKMAEAILTTSLTTQIPIKFELVAGSSTTACVVQNVTIQRRPN